jgi:non-homologous end joining protein Ku
VPKEEPSRRSGKVINLMDALRKSVKSGGNESRYASEAKSAKKKTVASNKSLRLVKPNARSTHGRTRKSA